MLCRHKLRLPGCTAEKKLRGLKPTVPMSLSKLCSRRTKEGFLKGILGTGVSSLARERPQQAAGGGEEVDGGRTICDQRRLQPECLKHLHLQDTSQPIRGLQNPPTGSPARPADRCEVAWTTPFSGQGWMKVTCVSGPALAISFSVSLPRLWTM